MGETTLNQFDGIPWMTLKKIQKHFNLDNKLASIIIIKSIVSDLLYLDEAKIFDDVTLLKNSLINYHPKKN